ncbi:alpha-hydroxy acid oxidase [Pseudooceanicola sp.]|uniref:alpha-hydroxy acid oxidase n=1 Tax=Pseudooceanicola sp. TaxID=1914328 RepID=UPI00262F18E6|nr:alpha-hydroxy acid oxidase [Pseudooceanicola sp.]MDF1854413.1 alpha-hydroxy acid oxidase [Pseudooceanicola sp.]
MKDTGAQVMPPPRPHFLARRRLKQALALDDFERLPKGFLPRPVFAYVAGASETGATIADNRAVYRELAFLPKTLVSVTGRSTRTRLFDQEYAAPFGFSPVGFSALTAYRGDLVLAQAAARANIPMIMSGASLIRLEEVAAAAPDSWFQIYLPGEEEVILSMLDRVAGAGFRTLVLTVDMPVVSNRETNYRAGFSAPLRPSLRLAWDGMVRPEWSLGTFLRTIVQHGMPHFENARVARGPAIVSRNVTRAVGARDHLNWDHVDLIRRHWKGRLIIKGIMTPGDAKLAVAHGADGVIVSNHGGRQMDSLPAPLRVLPAVAEAVAGRVPVMMDSGIRRGADVLKALALGADFVFAGRPFIFAAALAGAAGVDHAIRLLAEEVDRDMALIGINRLAEMQPEMLMRISGPAFGRFGL